MSDLIPPLKPSRGWQPTTSTAAGALIGQNVAQLICAALTGLAHWDLSTATVASISGLCIAIAGYCFPDGGRK